MTETFSEKPMIHPPSIDLVFCRCGRPLSEIALKIATDEWSCPHCAGRNWFGVGFFCGFIGCFVGMVIGIFIAR